MARPFLTAHWANLLLRVDLDWGGVYGADWKFLEGREPQSTVFAVGSPIAVSPKAVGRGRRAPALLPG